MAILELLSVCVETQPGLIEIFFDVQVGTAESAEGKKVRVLQNCPKNSETLKIGNKQCCKTTLKIEKS